MEMLLKSELLKYNIYRSIYVSMYRVMCRIMCTYINIYDNVYMFLCVCLSKSEKSSENSVFCSPHLFNLRNTSTIKNLGKNNERKEKGKTAKTNKNQKSTTTKIIKSQLEKKITKLMK